MNTGALKDRSGEDVELNSCSACAAGSCYAFVDGYCTALEPGAVHGSSDGCSFYKNADEEKRRSRAGFYALVRQNRFDLIRRYKDTYLALGIFDAEIHDALVQAEKLEKFRAINLENTRDRYAEGDTVILASDSYIDEYAEDDDEDDSGTETEREKEDTVGTVDSEIPGDEQSVEASEDVSFKNDLDSLTEPTVEEAQAYLRDSFLSDTVFENNRWIERLLDGADAGGITDAIIEEARSRECLEAEKPEGAQTAYTEEGIESAVAWSDSMEKTTGVEDEIRDADEKGKDYKYAVAVKEKRIPVEYAVYQLLGASIVYKAVEDYVCTMRDLWTEDGDRINRIIDKWELETFFGSRWYWQLTNINPEHVMDRCFKNADESEKDAIRRRNRFIVENETGNGGWHDLP